MAIINSIVGIIANPASGKDIRRLTAHGSVFDNNEKVNIVRRVFLGLEAAGVSTVLYMPDYFGIIRKALDGIKLSLEPHPLDMRMTSSQEDSTKAARLMAEAGARCLVTLGGDGTNRAVANGSVAVPFMPISTGTNNVFPIMVEGTLAGLAAGVVATGDVSLEEATIPSNRLDVLFDGQPGDMALVDIAVYDDAFVGSRAVWDMSKVREIFTAQAAPHNMGLSSISGCLFCSQLDGRHGSHIRLAADGEAGGLEVTAPVAPGMVEPIRVSSFRLLEVGDEIPVDLVPSVLALDGEREIETNRKQKISIRFSDQGPRVVDMNRTLQLASQRSHFNAFTAPASSEHQCLLAHLGICLNPCPDCK
ncbi:MAG: NAD(+)/NADH kinase [Chloroflexota bacterium]|nr:NAD(+)/NADH kinase [Chloroflexota bacterium]